MKSSLKHAMCMALSCVSTLWAQDSLYPTTDVYDSIEVLPYKMHGWHLHEAQVKDLFSRKDIRTVIEVGSWLGKWTIQIAKMLPEGGVIYAVDHWKGSVEHHNAGSLESTFLPKLFEQFLSNVIQSKVRDKVMPVRMNSLAAAKLFREQGITADLIYIDASHDYRSVLADITAWYPLVAEGGTFSGDDWNLGDVPRAVTDFAKRRGLTVCHVGDFWWYE